MELNQLLSVQTVIGLELLILMMLMLTDAHTFREAQAKKY